MGGNLLLSTTINMIPQLRITLPVLLRLAPLVTSSMSLWYCVDQYTFFRAFTVPSNREKGSAILPGYWNAIFTPAVGAIFALYSATIAGAWANRYWGGSQDLDGWYNLGILFSVGHFLFVPLVAPKIKAMQEDRSKGKENWKHMEAWLRVHVTRSLLVDLPGWLCFVAAAMSALEVVET